MFLRPNSFVLFIWTLSISAVLSIRHTHQAGVQSLDPPPAPRADERACAVKRSLPVGWQCPASFASALRKLAGTEAGTTEAITPAPGGPPGVDHHSVELTLPVSRKQLRFQFHENDGPGLDLVAVDTVAVTEAGASLSRGGVRKCAIEFGVHGCAVFRSPSFYYVSCRRPSRLAPRDMVHV